MEFSKMNRWDFKTATEYFATNKKSVIEDTQKYCTTDMIFSKTFDLREMHNPKKYLFESLAPNTLIFITGPSGNGKTTFAQRLQKLVNIEIVDVDKVVEEWNQKNFYTSNTLLKEQSMADILKTQLEYMKKGYEYLLNNIEKIVSKKAENGKSVIFIGLYIDLLPRSIVVRTLGKYFNNIVSIIMIEKTFEATQKLIETRENFKNSIWKSVYTEQYRKCSNLITSMDGILPGVGMNYSFIADSKVSNMLLE